MNPPDAIPDRSPTHTRSQRLPFEDLTWENFERLCLRLVAAQADVEYCARFGLPGEAQAGIDIFARKDDGGYHCLQAKRQREFGATKLKAAVDLFLNGEWADRSTKFTLAVQTGLGSAAVQREIEQQAERLRTKGISFHVLDGERLTDALRDLPALIDDFFGRAWVEAVVGLGAAARLGARLDGGEFARVRAQLARYYDAHFQTIDPGSFGSAGGDRVRPALTLLERFTKPDVLIREAAPVSDRADHGFGVDSGSGFQVDGFSPTAVSDTTRAPGGGAERSRSRRLPLSEWLAADTRLAVLGDAGSGKSTVLRAIVHDLLGDQSRFPELADRFGQHLPVHIPFARWASEAARDGAQVGIKEIVRRSLQPMLTAPIVDLLDRAIDERRILLLVDGLDEWSAEQAARTTLSNLVTLVEANDIPVIVSGRPRGVETIGPLPSAWKRGTIAPLSISQQRNIASIWFKRHAPADLPSDSAPSSSLRTYRFMAELARDAGLSALAGTPLLLVGLVTLSLRGQILPRTKSEVYDQLIRILLEVHPVRRATASGETVDRFQHARDPLQRRAAIARLAFETRLGPGDASLPEALARSIVKEHLSSPAGCGLPLSEAAAAAAEILSVNAETQGLIVEKGPAEVGFVHASFEEYLAAEHIAGWSLTDTVEFVRIRSGEARWRNVLVDLMAGLPRRDEFDRLVAVIEEADGDEVAVLQRAGLLGEIAFTAAGRSPATTRRLALDTLTRVEDSDWTPDRRDALRTVLRSVNEPFFASEVNRRLRGWVPARATYRSALMSELGHWQVTPMLARTLWRGLHDEDRGVQRSAAAAYARALKTCDDAKARLLNGLANARSLTASVAMLEALVLGWPNDPETLLAAEGAAVSASPELRLVGSLGLAEAGKKSEAGRLEALIGQQFWSDLSYPHRELAGAMLLKHWPDDDALLPDAIVRADGGSSPWEMELAFQYVLYSSTNRAETRRFVLNQLSKEYPFNVMHGGQIWSRVGAFALADPDIRAAASAYWIDPKHRLINMHNLADYAEIAPDDRLADVLVETLDGKRDMDRYWALDALLRGWGEDHPKVRPVLDGLAAQPDERLTDVVALLPKAFLNKDMARERILSIAARDDVRRDMVAIALENLGCKHADDEAVRAILREGGVTAPTFDPAPVLFRAFAGHPKVRALALRVLGEVEAPLVAIAKGYSDDPEISDELLRLATPLPTDLRSQVVEFAAVGSAGTVLEAVLAEGMRESDADLRVRMMTLHLRSLTDPDAIAGAKRTLLAEVHAVGSDHDSRRSAALAGLIALDDVDDLVGMQGYNGPLQLNVGGPIEGIPSMERLVCEKFGLLTAAFGDDLWNRFTRHGRGSRLAEVLSAAPSASPEARAAFLKMAEDGTMPLTTTALRSLAAERPRSALLLERCREALDQRPGTNDRPVVCAEIGLLLATEFPADPVVRTALEEAFLRSPFTDKAIALAVFAPESEVLPLPRKPEDLQGFGAVAAAMHVIGARGDTGMFLQFLDAMITSAFHTQFDGQQITNIAVTRRIQRDEDLQIRLADRLTTAVHPSIIGSNARQLATAGRLGPEGRALVTKALMRAGDSRRVPIAAYDAVGARWRTLRAILLDALRSEID